MYCALELTLKNTVLLFQYMWDTHTRSDTWDRRSSWGRLFSTHHLRVVGIEYFFCWCGFRTLTVSAQVYTSNWGRWATCQYLQTSSTLRKTVLPQQLSTTAHSITIISITPHRNRCHLISNTVFNLKLWAIIIGTDSVSETLNSFRILRDGQIPET
jgi:hypothetical protein